MKLIKKLKTGDWNATQTLIKIGKPAVPALIEVLKDKDSDVRNVAAEALGQIKREKESEPISPQADATGTLTQASIADLATSMTASEGVLPSPAVEAMDCGL